MTLASQLIVFATAAAAAASVGRLLASWDLLAAHCLRVDCSAAATSATASSTLTSRRVFVFVFYNSRARQLTRSAYGALPACPFDQIVWSMRCECECDCDCDWGFYCPLAAMISNLNFYYQHLQIMLQLGNPLGLTVLCCVFVACLPYLWPAPV